MASLFDHLSTPQCWFVVQDDGAYMCQSPTAMYSKYCVEHATVVSQEVARTINLLVAQARQEWLADVEDLRPPAPQWRTHDQGWPVVEVSIKSEHGWSAKNYAYRWTGACTVKVGDRVMIPPNDYSTEGALAEVKGLGTIHKGLLTGISTHVPHSVGTHSISG